MVLGPVVFPVGDLNNAHLTQKTTDAAARERVGVRRVLARWAAAVAVVVMLATAKTAAVVATAAAAVAVALTEAAVILVMLVKVEYEWTYKSAGEYLGSAIDARGSWSSSAR